MSGLTRRSFAVQTAAVALPSFISRNAHAAEFTYKFANELPDNHPVNVHAARAAARIKEATAGSVEIKIFPNSQLGSQTDMLTQVRAGSIEFVPVSGIILSSLVPVAAIHGLGFIFPNYASVWSAMDGAVGKHVRFNIEKTGLVVFDKIWDTGYRQITSGPKPITSPEDLKNFKIRVPVSALWTSMFAALGAAPVSISFGEVYSALQTRIVDGQETALSLVKSTKFYEVQKYCSLTNHMWDGPWLLANRRSWERLPEKFRQVVATTFNSAATEERADNERENETARADLTKLGMIFNDPNRAAFRDALKNAGFYRDWKVKFSDEAWAILEQSVGKLV